jgi:hypothetical protein
MGWLPANPYDLITGEPVERHKPLVLAPYQFAWLAPGREQ